jgi:hypothetical protein
VLKTSASTTSDETPLRHRIQRARASAHAALRHRIKKAHAGKRHRPAAVASMSASDHAASRSWQ